MANQPDEPASPDGLCFYWYETKPREEAETWWGQLVGGVDRLRAVRDELQRLRAGRNIEAAMRRLETHVESYLVRAFELRERALGLLAARAHGKKEVNKLHHPAERNHALSKLKAADPELTMAVGDLLRLLEDDILLRNVHTHGSYLMLGLYTGSEIFDPYDALQDLSYDSPSRRKLEAQLRREIKRTAERYVDKVQALLDSARAVLKAGVPGAGRITR